MPLAMNNFETRLSLHRAEHDLLSSALLNSINVKKRCAAAQLQVERGLTQQRYQATYDWKCAKHRKNEAEK